MIDAVPFASPAYLVYFGVLFFARAMDILSTWIATPNLLLEANPIARRLGWRWGIPVNFALCAVFARWPLTAVIVATTSMLVAARNFQSAWLMRSAGEAAYQCWVSERFSETPRILFIFCLLAQAFLIGIIGVAIIWFAGPLLVVSGIGAGIVAYAIALVVFSLLAIRRRRSAY